MKNPFHPPHNPAWTFEPTQPAFALNARTGEDHALIENGFDSISYVFTRVPENLVDTRWWCTGVALGGNPNDLAPFDGEETFPIGEQAQIWLETEWERVQEARPSMS